MTGNAAGGKRSRRYGRARPISEHLKPITKRSFGKRGFADGDIIADWPAVIGPELAKLSAPERIVYPRGKRAGGTLHLRIASGSIAVELQHLAPLLIERINGYFGYGAVAHIHLIQAPIPQACEKRTSEPSLDADTRDYLAALIADVEDDGLKASLEELGRSILSRSPGNQSK